MTQTQESVWARRLAGPQSRRAGIVMSFFLADVILPKKRRTD
jgi:hypothetical protein